MKPTPQLKSESRVFTPLPKVATGISGFDEIINGGLPVGRTILVRGGPGCGKTLFAMQTLIHRAREMKEAGILVAFEENANQIVANAATLGWNIPALAAKKLFFLDASLSPETSALGDGIDLARQLNLLGALIAESGSKYIVFDGIDVLLRALDDPAAERCEVCRLRGWIARSGLTAIITQKVGPDGDPTDQHDHFMQFMADCVVTLSHQVVAGVLISGAPGTAESTLACLIVDPLSALSSKLAHLASADATQMFLDYLKIKGITVINTSLLDGPDASEATATGISTLADTWIHVSYVVNEGERNRALTIVKSRGTGHSNQVRELTLSDTGVSLTDVYMAQGEVLMGVARWEREQEELAAKTRNLRATAIARVKLTSAQAEAAARLAVITTEIEVRAAELALLDHELAAASEVQSTGQTTLRKLRHADVDTPEAKPPRRPRGRPPKK